MATAIGECAQAVTDLSSSDVGKQLSYALAELAEVERKAQEMEGTQSDQDLSTFMATVDEYARLINSVRVRSLSMAQACSNHQASVRLHFHLESECTMRGKLLRMTCSGRNRRTKRIVRRARFRRKG